MGIVKTTKLRCRVTVSHNHPVNFVNEIHKMFDYFVISNPFCLKKKIYILNGRGLRYSNFQILTTGSSNK